MDWMDWMDWMDIQCIIEERFLHHESIDVADKGGRVGSGDGG